jgi:capsular polysaccharide transport system permease protein
MGKRPPFQVMRVLGALMIREMITRYGRSWGGYTWAIVEPAGMICAFSLLISQFVPQPTIGNSFLLFYATGYMPFNLFRETAANTGNAVSVNRALMQLPMITPLDAILARMILTLLTSLTVTVLLIGGLLIYQGDPVHIDIGAFAGAYGMATLLGLGVGILNSVIFVFVPVWRQIWGLISSPLMIVSGTFFSLTSMPTTVQQVLIWNPMIHVVGAMRIAFYQGYDGDYVSLAYPCGIGLFLAVIGAALLKRHRGAIIDER